MIVERHGFLLLLLSKDLFVRGYAITAVIIE